MNYRVSALLLRTPTKFNKNLLLLLKRKAAQSFLKIPKGLFLVLVIPCVGSFMYLTTLIWFISNISLYGIWLLQWLIQWILWILPDTLKMTSFHVFFY